MVDEPSKEEVLRTEVQNPEVRSFLEREFQIIKAHLQSDWRVVDVGCGDGRLIPLISPLIAKYQGFDNDAELVETAREKWAGDKIEILELDAHNMRGVFGPKSVEACLCCWQTLGIMRPPEENVLSAMADAATELVFISVTAKGSLDVRVKYYEALNIPYSVDHLSETITSPVWGPSRAYSEFEIKNLAHECGLNVKSLELVAKHLYCCVFTPGETNW